MLTNAALGKGVLKIRCPAIRNGFIDAVMTNQQRFVKQ